MTGRIMGILNKDKKLAVLLGGMVIDGIILIALVVIAGTWFIL